MVAAADTEDGTKLMTSYFVVAPVIWPVILLAGAIGLAFGFVLAFICNGSDRLAQDLRSQAELLADSRQLADVLKVNVETLTSEVRTRRTEVEETNGKLHEIAEIFVRRENEHKQVLEETPRACPSCPNGPQRGDLHTLDGATKADVLLLRGLLSVCTKAELQAKACTLAKRKALSKRSGIDLEKLTAWAKPSEKPKLEVVEGGKKRKQRNAA